MKNISSDLRIKIEFSEYNFYRNILVRWVKNFKIVLFIGLVIFFLKIYYWEIIIDVDKDFYFWMCRVAEVISKELVKLGWVNMLE